MKIFTTNLALGHFEYAILLHIENDNYLCIERHEFDVDENETGTYDVGKIYDMKDCEYGMEEFLHYDLSQSPLHGTFLFDYFLKTLNK